MPDYFITLWILGVVMLILSKALGQNRELSFGPGLLFLVLLSLGSLFLIASLIVGLISLTSFLLGASYSG